jgi:hypothetical protein
VRTLTTRRLLIKLTDDLTIPMTYSLLHSGIPEVPSDHLSGMLLCFDASLSMVGNMTMSSLSRYCSRKVVNEN